MDTLSACWDWKVEPMSPGFTSPDHETDFWGHDDDVTFTSSKVVKDEPVESKSAAQLLDELDEWIKEEPFAIWLEEKIDLPFLDIPEPVHEPRAYSQSVRGNNEAVKPQAVLEVKSAVPSSQYVVPCDTQSLLQEFESLESLFGEVEHSFATPPQSPTQPPLPLQVTTSPSTQTQYSGVYSQDPNGSPLFITTLQQITPLQNVRNNSYQFASVAPVSTVTSILSPIPVSYVEKKESLIPNLEQIVPSPAPDIDEELAAVDEFIRTHVEDLETSIPTPQEPESIPPAHEFDANSSSSFQERATLNITPPSPSTTSNSSFESEDTADDPEWMPEPVHALSSSGCEKVTGGRKRSAKPYARIGTEEKKLRKKEQNKNAATRYRQKKKAEVEEIQGEEKQLADINEQLQSNVNDLTREIKYLKGLMRDVFKAKGLLK